jgi:hypothetical protein
MTKLTGREKEEQIMKEIRSNQVKFQTKFEGSLFGQFFGFATKA